MPDPFRHADDVFFDVNGYLTERVHLNGHDAVIHYADDIPDSDLTVVDGLPCTTPVRTVIDLAIETDLDDLATMVQDCLARELFTLDEARARLDQPDMRGRLGADRLRRVLPG